MAIFAGKKIDNDFCTNNMSNVHGISIYFINTKDRYNWKF